MNGGWIERRYGHGAGRVALAPAPWQARALKGLRQGFLEARRDGDTPGTSFAEILRASPAFLALAVALTLVFARVLTPPADDSRITIVAYDEVPAPAPPAPEEAPPPAPAPEPVPERVVRATPKPPPEPPPPHREALPRERPPRPAAPPPRPAMPQIARMPEPAPEPVTAPSRVTREPVRQAATAPRLRVDPLAAPALPEPAAPAPTRAPRFAMARPPDAMPRLDAPGLPAPVAPAARALPPATTREPSPRSAGRRREVPRLAPAAVAPALPHTRARQDREITRAAAPPTTPRSTRRRNVALAVPGAEPPSRPRSMRASPPAEPAPAPARTPAARAQAPGVRGVPLASLAACVSDRLEDELKQKVVAVVGDRTHCQSPAGRYDFVETRNVNAFLMRIERAGRRGVGDRCAELTFALDCLTGRKR